MGRAAVPSPNSSKNSKDVKLSDKETLAIVEDMRQKRVESVKNFFTGMAKAVTTDLPGFLMDFTDRLAGDTATFGEKDRSAQLFEKMTGIKTKSGSGGVDEFLGSMIDPVSAIGAAKAVIVPAFVKDLNKYGEAIEASTKGMRGEELWKAHGVFEDPITGQLLSVIPDTGAKFKAGALEIKEGFQSMHMSNNPSIKGILAQSLFDTKQLDEILDNPAMFALMPDLSQTFVRKPFMANYRGSFDHTDNTIRINSGQPNQMLSTMLHEVQHAIQNNYSMPRGGNTDMFIDNAAKLAETKKKGSEAYTLLTEEFDKIYKGTPGFERSIYPSAKLQKMFRDVTDDKYPYNKAAAEKFLSTIDQQVLQDYTVVDNLSKSMKILDKVDDDAYQAYRSLAGEAQARLVQKQFELQDYTTYPLKLMAEELGLKNIDDLFAPNTLLDPSDKLPKLDLEPDVRNAMHLIDNTINMIAKAKAATSKSPKK